MDVHGQPFQWNELPAKDVPKAIANLNQRQIQISVTISDLKKYSGIFDRIFTFLNLGITNKSKTILSLTNEKNQILRLLASGQKIGGNVSDIRSLGDLIKRAKDEVKKLDTKEYAKALIAKDLLFPGQKLRPEQTQLLDDMAKAQTRLKGLELIQSATDKVKHTAAARITSQADRPPAPNFPAPKPPTETSAISAARGSEKDPKRVESLKAAVAALSKEFRITKLESEAYASDSDLDGNLSRIDKRLKNLEAAIKDPASGSLDGLESQVRDLRHDIERAGTDTESYAEPVESSAYDESQADSISEDFVVPQTRAMSAHIGVFDPKKSMLLQELQELFADRFDDTTRDLEEMNATELQQTLELFKESDTEPSLTREQASRAGSQRDMPVGVFDRTKSLLDSIATDTKIIAAQKKLIEGKVVSKLPFLSFVPKVREQLIERKLQNAFSKNENLKTCNNRIEQSTSDLRAILRNGNFSTPEQLQGLSREEVAVLKKEITFILNNPEGLDAAIIDKLKSAQVTIESMSKKNSNEHLIDVIIGRSEPIGSFSAADMRDALLLSGGSTIKGDELIELVTQNMLMTPNNDERIRLSSFCFDWCTRNYGTKGFEQAYAKLTAFIEANPEQFTPQQRIAFGAALDQAAKAKPTKTFVAGDVNFASSLESVAAGTLEKQQRAQLVNQVAQDMRRLQASYYLQLTPDNLFKAKWDTNSSQQEKEYTANFNKLSFFIADNLVKAGSPPEQRANRIKFFIDVASEAIKNGDLYTAFIINSALSNASVFAMKTAWQNVNTSTGYPDKLENLKALFSTNLNFKAYKEHVASVGVENIMPYIGLAATEQTFLVDGNPKIDAESGNYNFAKRLIPIKTTLEGLVAGQKKLQTELAGVSTLATDLGNAVNSYQFNPATTETELYARLQELRKNPELEVR